MRIRMHWGTGLALAYTAFALATTGFVAFAMGRPVDLVSPDYYADSLRQDARMDAERHAQALRPAPRVETGPHDARLILPAGQASAARGTLRFYRPSDSRADRELPLSLDPGGEQRLPFDGLLTGRWILQVRWTAGGRDYYFEAPVMVP
jgi:hypothetical protein